MKSPPPPTTSAPVTFSVGQAVRWPVAHMRVAQVDELRRTRVRLVYATRGGRTRFALVRADRLAAVQRRPPGEESALAAVMHNPLGRAARPRSKTFENEPREGAKRP